MSYLHSWGLFSELLLPVSIGKTIQAATIPWALNYYTESEFIQHISQRIDLASSCVPPYKYMDHGIHSTPAPCSLCRVM